MILDNEVLDLLPLLLLEEEGWLHDMPLRESFVERVFGHFRLTNKGLAVLRGLPVL